MYVIMNADTFLKKGYTISTDKNLLDFDTLYKYLSEDSYWAQGLPADTFKRSIENSMCFGVYKETNLAGLPG
jgi:hypothetical protein